MKIASLFASLKTGWWVEKIQSNLSIWLTDLWYNFTNILLEDIEPRNEYKWKIISLKSPFIIWFGIKKIISLFTNAYKVAKICKKENIEILIWQGDYFYMVSGLVKLFWFKWKNIAVVHTTIWIWWKYLNLLLRFFLSLHNKIVFTAKEEQETFIKKYWFKRNKTSLIYNAIDIEKIDLLKNESIDDFNFDKWTFINIWRLTYQKWQDKLLKAFDKFNQKYNNSQLIILWDWELKDNLESLKNSLSANEDIHFLWNKKNVYKYLNKSNCFVLSSDFEGFPMVLIEAICLWRPIISINCPTWPKELINENDDFTNKLSFKKYDVWYLTWLNEESENNLFLAMEDFYLKQNINYDIKKFREIFSIENNIGCRKKIIESF